MNESGIMPSRTFEGDLGAMVRTRQRLLKSEAGDLDGGIASLVVSQAEAGGERACNAE